MKKVMVLATVALLVCCTGPAFAQFWQFTPGPGMFGSGWALCGASAGYAATNNWVNGAGYGNGWHETLTSPCYLYDGTGTVDLSLWYFNQTEPGYDYTRVWAVNDIGSRCELTGGGWTGAIGIDGSCATGPVFFTHTITNSELGGGISPRRFHIVIEFTSNATNSDETGGFDSCSGAVGIDNATIANNITGCDKSQASSYFYDFETGLQGWVPGGSSADSAIVATGWDAYGQCSVPYPNAAFAEVSAGGGHSLGLKSDGTIVAWGYDGYGQCVVPSPNTDFASVAAGRDHSLGLKSDGTIVAWGRNDFGQCNVPTPNAGFIGIASSYYHNLGLKSDGTIVAWGYNNYGQCTVPSPNAGFVAVAAGQYHSLGLKSDGTIVAWGYNGSGQCSVPTPNSGFAKIAGSYNHSLGLKSDGTIVAWGMNDYGQSVVPSPNSGFMEVAAGYFHSLGLKSDGTIVAWGYNNYGQCTIPSPNAGFKAIAGGHFHTLGIRSPVRVPVLAGAYATGTSTVNVQFNVDLDETTAESPSNYEFASGAMVTTATLDPVRRNTVGLTASQPFIAGSSEQIIVSNVKSSAGIFMTPNQTRDFRAGITPIYDVQYVATPATNDASNLAGEVVTIEGRVTALRGDFCFVQDGNGAQWRGLYCRVAGTDGLQLGDRVQVSGEVTEYGGMTALDYLYGVDNFVDLGVDPNPVVVNFQTTANLHYRDPIGTGYRSAERWEGCLVKLLNATFRDSLIGTPGPYYHEWLLRQGVTTDTSMIDLDGLTSQGAQYDPCPGNRADVTGILMYVDGEYRICPRSGPGGDIVELYAVPGCPTTGVDPIAPKAALDLRQNRPNPFGLDTSIGFTLPRASQVRLEVLDVSGRLVRVLAAGPLATGEHVYRWDGMTDAGRRAAAGTYFYRLRCDGRDTSRRMVLLN